VIRESVDPARVDAHHRGPARGAAQKSLGDADPRSADAYGLLADNDTIDMIRRRKD
jgi:hypothetical protein